MRGSVVLALAGGTMLSGAAMAQLDSIDSMIIQERFFNDYPNSNLEVVNEYPVGVLFHESDFGQGGFANRHRGRFSNDGGAPSPTARSRPSAASSRSSRTT
jgi:hypothetical protein